MWLFLRIEKKRRGKQGAESSVARKKKISFCCFCFYFQNNLFLLMPMWMKSKWCERIVIVVVAIVVIFLYAILREDEWEV